MSDPGWTRIDLGLGAYVLYKFVSDAEIDVQLWFQTVELADGTINEANPELKLHVGEELIRADLDLTLEPFLGQVLAEGDVAVNVNGTWTPVAQFPNTPLFLYDPTKGLIAGKTVPFPPMVPGNPGQWAPSYCSSGNGITRFHITDDERVLSDIGSRVKQMMFPGYAPLVMNIVACCGQLNADGTGPYVDPTTPWFNIFFGAYQIDCLKSDGWTRPFGYETPAGKGSAVRPVDIERIGKSDWNWISNFMYGVPADVCAEYSNIGSANIKVLGVQQIGSSLWHAVSMSNVTVASAYESNASGARKLVDNSPLTPEFQQSFGKPCPRDGYPISFVPSTLESAIFMAYREDALGFSTLMFGGTTSGNQPFLAAQVAAVKQTMAINYSDAGFPPS